MKRIIFLCLLLVSLQAFAAQFIKLTRIDTDAPETSAYVNFDLVEDVHELPTADGEKPMVYIGLNSGTFIIVQTTLKSLRSRSALPATK